MVQLWFQINRIAKCSVKNHPKSHYIANTPRNNDSLSRKTTAETQEVERLTVVRRKHMIFYPFFFHFFGASLGFSCIWAFGSILAKMGINKVMYRRDENHSHKLKPKSPFGNIMGNEISLSKNIVYKPLIKRVKKQ